MGNHINKEIIKKPSDKAMQHKLVTDLSFADRHTNFFVSTIVHKTYMNKSLTNF